MSLNLNWYKSYDTKRKNSKNANLCFWTKLQKNAYGNISILSHNFWTNQNLLEFRPVKHVIMTVWTSVFWKMNIHISKQWPELVVTRSFIKGHSFPISLYLIFCLHSTCTEKETGLTNDGWNYCRKIIARFNLKRFLAVVFKKSWKYIPAQPWIWRKFWYEVIIVLLFLILMQSALMFAR